MIGRIAAIFTAIVVLVLVWMAWRDWKGGDESGAPATQADGTGAEGGAAGSASDASGAAAKAKPSVIVAMSESGVKITVRKRDRIDTAQPPYAAALQKLQAASDAGDPVARYQSGLILYECRDVPVDDAALAKEVEEIHQTRRHDGWEVTDPESEERALRASYASCAGVPPEARERYRDLLKAAADSGLMEAQLDLMYHLPKGEYCQYIEDCSPQAVAAMGALRDEAKAYVQKALEGGSVEAMRTVGGWYLNDEMGTPDEVQAYAYLSAYDQVQKAAGREREVLNMLNSLKKRLRAVDLEQANDRAKELLSNPNCCLLTK